MYALLMRHVLARLDAERVHHATLALLRLLQALPPARAVLARLLGRPDPVLVTTAFGRRLASPLGMAAGFDKDAEVVDALGATGFGFVEVGTVTAAAQPGNPRPRLVRLPADRALVNRMGFNNHGAAAAAGRLARRRPADRLVTAVGANIGKTKAVPAEDAVADYAQSARLLAPHADYLVVNVSSPNTPGLRDLQATEALRPILQAVQAEARGLPAPPPVLVKIAPDLADADVDAVADLALEIGLDGIVAANTTIARPASLRTPPAEVAAAGAGGLSGPVLAERSLALLRRLRGRVGPDLLLVSVGGIADGDDAYERLAAGADLVQAYTGVVYGGPRYAARANRRLAERYRTDGRPGAVPTTD